LIRSVRILGWALAGVAGLAAIATSVVIVQHRQGVAQAEEEFRAHRPPPLQDLGTTKKLTVLPLLDWHAARPDLETDAGVSYLVETDHVIVLFDTGNNTRDSDPAPLENNMKTLGVSIDDIDAIVISHAHLDHTGGRRWTGGRITGTTFGIGNEQPGLAGKTILTASPMTYPGSAPVLARDPVRLAPGVGTTGTISRKLFGGWIDEQALAVNVDGKGIVLIVGCGHQTIPRLIERTEAVFDAPLYGVIGGLHYPVPEGRMRMFGIDVQHRFASGTGPLAPLNARDVRADIELLKERDLGVVSVGGHDSSDEALGWFRDAFGPAYRDLKVGEPIQVGP
jgi:7,8-dihydropterin-6-yl-methyl-4-(beta-D-ribofuranosyl)aminobenzene 5'-phosphate synthase